MRPETGLRALIAERFPGASISEIRTLGVDEAPAEATRKGTGYGAPIRVDLRDADGTPRALVFHTAKADDFGHDRRSDRAAEMLLAYDTFGRIPHHVQAVDVGVIGVDGNLRSIADAGELYLLTEWVEGTLYADDLRRVAAEGATPDDLLRAEVLADYLVTLHGSAGGGPATYTRAVRDLVGSGEGIFGMVDGYPDDVPGAAPARLRRIEERCLHWRWRLRGRERRVARTHGDFHPFNILFGGDGRLAVLDASRGCSGDPADDLTALSINYVFFALDARGAWRRGLGALWHAFWRRYLDVGGDREALDVAAPWLAWRALVLANPRWYPGLSPAGREALLGWIERVLEARRLDLDSAAEVPP
jgi:hypothetical protein